MDGARQGQWTCRCVEGDGGVGGKNNGLRRVWGWNPVRVGAGERHRGGTRVQARNVRVGAKTRGVWP